MFQKSLIYLTQQWPAQHSTFIRSASIHLGIWLSIQPCLHTPVHFSIFSDFHHLSLHPSNLSACCICLSVSAFIYESFCVGHSHNTPHFLFFCFWVHCLSSESAEYKLWSTNALKRLDIMSIIIWSLHFIYCLQVCLSAVMGILHGFILIKDVL